MINSNFVILAAMLNLIGSGSYVIDTLRGKTKPNRVTWSLWALAPLIAFSAELTEGVGIQSLMTFMVGFGPLMVLLASLINRKAFWKIDKFDIACGALSFFAIVLWLITKTGTIAIILSILADGMAAVPTIKKAYKEPQSESYNVFLLGSISALITLLTIKTWDFAHYAFPLYIFAVCLLLVILILPRQKFQLLKA